jgi:hypothetical protein
MPSLFTYFFQGDVRELVAIPGVEARARWILPEKLGFSQLFCTLNLQTGNVPRILTTSFLHMRRGNSILIFEDFGGQIGTNPRPYAEATCACPPWPGIGGKVGVSWSVFPLSS